METVKVKEKREPVPESEAPKTESLLCRGIQGRVVYFCLLFLFFTELVLSYFLYEYISLVEKKCVDIDLEVPPTKSTRRKRAPILEDNAVTTSDDSTVEFFNPKLKHELSEKDVSRHGGHKFRNGVSAGGSDGGSASTPSDGESANNPWVWLTSYSRIPVRIILNQS